MAASYLTTTRIFTKRLVVLAALALAGCATVGHEFDMAKVAQLTPGVSSEADAKALLGEPVKVETSSDGEVLTWKYVVASGLVLGTHGQGVQIAFDGNGKMIRIVKRASV